MIIDFSKIKYDQLDIFDVIKYIIKWISIYKVLNYLYEGMTVSWYFHAYIVYDVQNVFLNFADY
jgi:hypothetical protein